MLGKTFKTNNFGECFVIDYVNTKNITVMFYDCSVKVTTLSNLKRGCVGFTNHESKYIGQKFNTKYSGFCEIYDYKSSKEVYVIFEDGYKTKTNLANIKSGRVGNINRARVFGEGVCDMENVSDLKEYKLWSSILRRAYSDVYHKNKKSYKDVEVCESWKRFSNFYNDISKIPFYEKSINDNYELDKDILIRGNRFYKPDAVCFVPKEINSALINKGGSGSNGLPVGVSKAYSKYIVNASDTVTCYLERLGLKRYNDTPEQAFNVYIMCKKAYLKDLAEKYKGEISDDVYLALLNYQFDEED